MAQTVIGFFENNLAAYKAVAGLTSRGIESNQIDITKEASADTAGVAHQREEESGVTRFFKNLFGNSDEADRYAKVSRSGYTLVTVYARTSDEAERAARLLDDFGALDVDERVGQTQYNASGKQETDVDNKRNTGREETIERINEHVDISKQREERGGVRLRSRIVEKPVEEQIRLREERIRVERNPIDRVASEADLQSFQEGEIELTERKEVPVVNKEARVVEEIRLHKEVEERDETVHEKLRHTEVDVNKLNKNDNAYSQNQSFDNRLNEGNRNSGHSGNINDMYSDDKKKGRRDGDPLFGA